MKKRVLNKQGNFGIKILWRYTDMAIFVLRCFILTHPVLSRVTMSMSMKCKLCEDVSINCSNILINNCFNNEF